MRDWRLDGVCASVDPEAWFPDYKIGNDRYAVQMICESCRVRELCLAEAFITDSQQGIWGGITENARRKWHTLFNGGGVDAYSLAQRVIAEVGLPGTEHFLAKRKANTKARDRKNEKNRARAARRQMAVA